MLMQKAINWRKQAHLVAAQQSVRVITLNPASYAARIVDSTQQFVRKPASATFLMPLCCRMKGRLVEVKPHRPDLPCTICRQQITERGPARAQLIDTRGAHLLPAHHRVRIA